MFVLMCMCIRIRVRVHVCFHTYVVCVCACGVSLEIYRLMLCRMLSLVDCRHCREKCSVVFISAWISLIHGMESGRRKQGRTEDKDSECDSFLKSHAHMNICTYVCTFHHRVKSNNTPCMLSYQIQGQVDTWVFKQRVWRQSTASVVFE
jgi:hypothetical protein